MKRILLSMIALTMCLSFNGFSQQSNKLKPATEPIPKTSERSVDLNTASRSMTCVDTISYPFAKEEVLGTPTYYTFGIWQSDAEAFSQTFYAYSTGLTISAVEIIGRNNSTNGTTSSTVRARIYSVDGLNNPTGAALATGSVSVTSTSVGVYYVNFTTPITVTSNYAIVVDVINAGGVFDMFVNNNVAGQTYDEGLSRFKSSYAGYGSNGNWIPIPSVTGLGGVYDFEPLVGAVVSYGINTTATATPTTACLGQPVNFSNTTVNPYLSSRMYNANIFETYFGLATTDSTYAWAPDQTNLNNLIWQQNTSYTYPAAGSYIASPFILGGLVNSCVDFISIPITINPIADAAFAYASSTVCAGGANVTPSSVATPGGTFSSSTGLVFANATTGEINVVASTPGTYTITYNTGGACSATSTQSLTITAAPDASFTYSASSYCVNGSNPTPTVTGSVGTFSSTTGLSVNGSTGVINLATSTPGTYTVTNTINTPGCPVTTDQETVTINAVDNASFAYASSIVCSGGANVTPSTVATPGGTFSSTAGLVFANATTGEINVAGSTVGTYTVTYTTNGACPSTSTQSFTITTAPTASFTYAQSTYCSNDVNPTPTVTGTAGVFSSTAGLDVNGSTGAINLSNSTAGAYTVTNTVTISGCPTATETFNITVNAAPSAVVTLSGTTLTAQEAGAIYQWYDCATSSAVAGATNQTFSPSTPGSYKVTVTNGGCSATSACETVTNAGIVTNGMEAVAIYPNPTENIVTISGLTAPSTIVSVLDLNGKVVSSKTIATTTTTISLENVVNGVYFIKIQSESVNGFTKVVKK